MEKKKTTKINTKVEICFKNNDLAINFRDLK